MDKLPSFFSDKRHLLNYDYSQLDDLIGSEIDYSFKIENLSPDMDNILGKYYKSIILGYNHVFIHSILQFMNNPSLNISLPLLHDWGKNPKIENLIIISNPEDAGRICKSHIKKAPIFKKLLNNSIISTTDNDDWKEQRNDMNNAFLPNYSLLQVFPESVKRASSCSELLIKMSSDYTEPVNMSDFFLNETQAQLQKVMFGFSDEFEIQTNKRIRNAFAGIETEYLGEFSKIALEEASKSDGPASKLFNNSKDIKKEMGNMLLFAFAGHDTTGHTLTWLLYELCKHPKYKARLIQEIDEYWLNNKEENYNTFNELPFMTKCITETLRMWPAFANGTYRELEKDDYVIGHNGERVKLLKGTYCQIINWTRHRNPELWNDPHTFNPDRKFEESEIWHNQGFGGYNVSSGRFSPFTYGPRNCLGKNFSQMEMRLILLHLFRDHDFTLEKRQKQTVNDKKYMGINTLTMGPSDVYGGLLGMYVDITLRKSKL
jgi:cytochrome P450